MNGIDIIIQRIGEDSQAQVDRTLAAAREEAGGITARFQAQAAQEGEELSAQNRKAAAEREERLVSVAQLESRKLLLSAKQEMVERTFQRALEKLNAMPDERAIQISAQLLKAAASDGTGSVVFSAMDRARIGAAAVAKANELLGEKGRLILSDETRELDGGFILVSGRVEINCTFSTLVRLQKADCAGEIARRLFPDS